MKNLSPLKWAGGKSWLVGDMLNMYRGTLNGKARRFVEPFCGSCAITLGVGPTSALCGDTLVPLINFWQQVKRGLTFDPAEWQTDEAAYYEVRTAFNRIYGHPGGRINSIYEGGGEQGARYFYYLNRRGFNGLCRFNSKGGFNVPWGKYKTPIPPIPDLGIRLMNVEFVNADFRHVLGRLDENDFVYADPPYDGGFTDYAAGGFSWKDQEELAKRLAAHRGPVVISNLATTRIVDLYESLDFDVEYRTVQRRISCDGDRQPARELLATRNL